MKLYIGSHSQNKLEQIAVQCTCIPLFLSIKIHERKLQTLIYFFFVDSFMGNWLLREQSSIK